MTDLCNSLLKFVNSFFNKKESFSDNSTEMQTFSLIHGNTYQKTPINDTQPTRENSGNLYDNYIPPPRLPQANVIIFNGKKNIEPVNLPSLNSALIKRRRKRELKKMNINNKEAI
jgi:hypothetical protein